MTSADECKPRKEVINHSRGREVINYRAVPTGCRRFRSDDPFSSGRFWTRSGRAHAHSASHTSRQKIADLQGKVKPSVGLEPTTLPHHGRVRVLRAFTDALGMARNPCKQPHARCTDVAADLRSLWI